MASTHYVFGRGVAVWRHYVFIRKDASNTDRAPHIRLRKLITYLTSVFSLPYILHQQKLM